MGNGLAGVKSLVGFMGSLVLFPVRSIEALLGVGLVCFLKSVKAHKGSWAVLVVARVPVTWLGGRCRGVAGAEKISLNRNMQKHWAGGKQNQPQPRLPENLPNRYDWTGGEEVNLKAK